MTYTLDKVGNVEKQINNANQSEISYEYNGNGQVTKITDLDGKTEEYTYDEYGNLIKHKQKDGTEIIRGYDANFNLVSEKAYDYVNDAVCEEASISSAYTYDALNRLSTVTDSTGTTTFTYDVLGNIATVTRGTETTSYQYNAYGEKFKVIYPDGSEQSYTYDGAGRISSTTVNGFTVTYTYDALGNILTETYTNGLVVTKTYDAAGNLATQKTEKNGTILSEYTYGYDGNNSLVSETRTVDGVTETVEHEYNERDELVETASTVNNVTTTTEYTYSLTGNKATAVNGTGTQSFTYNDSNQLTQMSDEEGTVSYTYDDRGNRISESRGLNNTKTYSYDIMNRLISVTDYDGTVITYSYDGLGNRISETINSEGTVTNITYVNDYTQDVVEVLSKTTGTVEENYYYGNDRISSDDTIYGYDGLSNVNMTLSLTGSIQKKYEYSDYGKRSLDSKTEIINNEFGTNGEAHTADGLQYLRSRYYDPVTGVFISADSYRGELNNLLSQNRYTYCHNNPYKYDDPTGHAPIAGINKNTVSAYDSGTAVKPKPPQKAIQQNVVYEEYRPSNAQEANQRNQQNAFTGTVTLLGSTDKAPAKETVPDKEEAKATGEQENDDIGTVSTIVTDSHDPSQPYEAETYDLPEREIEVMETKDMAKMILSGMVMTGIGILAAGFLTLVGVATPIAAVAVAAITGFAGSYVNAATGALVENQSFEEYGRSQGYETIEMYKNKIYQEAIVGATVGVLVSMLTLGLLYGTTPIGNSINDDLANVAANQGNETATVLSQGLDDGIQISDEFEEIISQNIIEKNTNPLNGLPEDVGFDSFKAFKKEFGAAEQGYEWHHIVEQSQIKKSGFPPQQIHNTSNMIQVEKSVHHQITGYYNAKYFEFTYGESVRDWLSGQTFEFQTEFGVKVLKGFGVVE